MIVANLLLCCLQEMVVQRIEKSMDFRLVI